MLLIIPILIEIIFTYAIRIFFKIDTVEGLVLVIITLFIFIIWVMTNRKITKRQRLLLILGYFIRLAIIITRNLTNITLLYTNDDALGFHNRGILVANNLSLLQKRIYGGYYTKILGILYYLVGVNRLFAENINVLLSIGIYYNVFIIINQFDIKDNFKRNLLETILVFLPNGIFISASLLREMLIGLFAILSLRYCFNYLNLKDKKYIFLCLSSIMIASIFHSGILFLICGYVLAISFYNFKEKKINMDIKKATVFLILSIALFVFYLSYGDIFASKIVNVDVEKTIESEAGGGSAYLGGKEINDIGDVIIYTIPKTIYFMFSPMPWDWRGVVDMITFLLDSLIYLYLIYNIIKNHKYLTNERKSVIDVLLFGLILTIVVYALGTANAGTATRHRYKIFPYLITITALCMDSKEKKSNEDNIC